MNRRSPELDQGQFVEERGLGSSISVLGMWVWINIVLGMRAISLMPQTIRAPRVVPSELQSCLLQSFHGLLSVWIILLSAGSFICFWPADRSRAYLVRGDDPRSLER